MKVVKEDVTYGPDELCLSGLELDFGISGQFKWRGHLWVSNTDSEPQLMVEQEPRLGQVKQVTIVDQGEQNTGAGSSSRQSVERDGHGEEGQDGG